MIRKHLVTLMLGTLCLGIANLGVMPILNPIARSLSVSVNEAGQLVTAYAAGVVTGIVLLLVLRNVNLKTILLLDALFIALGNGFSALASTYIELMICRFASGLPDGILFATGAIVASMLADGRKKDRDVTLMVLGQTTACLIGVPLATWLSHLFSWRILFGLVAVLGCMFLVGTLLFIPSIAAPGKRQFKENIRFLAHLHPWILLTSIALGSGGFFAYYSYINPISESVARLSASDMSWVIALAGCAMVMGNGSSAYLTRWVSDEGLSTGAQGSLFIAVTLAYFISGTPLGSIFCMMLAAGSNFFLAGPEQALLIRDAKSSELIIAAFGQTAFNLGNAFGAFLGGNAVSIFRTPVAASLPASLMTGVSFLLLLYFWRQSRRLGYIGKPSRLS